MRFTDIFILNTDPLFLFSTLSIVLLFVVWVWIKGYTPPSSVPRPPGTDVFIMGSFPLLSEHQYDTPDFLHKYTEKFGLGNTFCMPVPNLGMVGKCIFVVSGESVKHVLQDAFNNYEKGPTFREGLVELLGSGIFTADGDSWKHHRKVASNMFSRNLMRHSTIVAEKGVKVLIEEMKRKIGKEKSVVFDMQELFHNLTIDIFSSIAFGVDLQATTSETQHRFAAAFDSVQYYSQKRFSQPFWKVTRFFQASEGERKITEGAKVIDAFAKEVIETKKRDQSSDMGPDLLSRFLDTKDGEPVPDNTELRDIVINFMLAGRDTTAGALSWMIYELSLHPEISKKILDEFVSVFSDKDSEVTYDKLAELKYSNAAAMETLRLHPSVPFDMKMSVNDDTLPDGTFVPAACSIIYSPYAMNRSVELWGDDVLEFQPSRFMDVAEPSAFKYTTFNAGPRLCLGKGLALLEIKLAMGMLLREFEFEKVAPYHTGDYETSLTMKMKDGIKMAVSNRV